MKSLLVLAAVPSLVLASVSIYTAPPHETPLFLHAYDPATLDPPPLPSPPAPTSFPIQLQTNPAGLSIPHAGNFLGLSIELSLASAVSECRVTPYFHSSS